MAVHLCGEVKGLKKEEEKNSISTASIFCEDVNTSHKFINRILTPPCGVCM